MIQVRAPERARSTYDSNNYGGDGNGTHNGATNYSEPTMKSIKKYAMTTTTTTTTKYTTIKQRESE